VRSYIVGALQNAYNDDDDHDDGRKPGNCAFCTSHSLLSYVLELQSLDGRKGIYCDQEKATQHYAFAEVLAHSNIIASCCCSEVSRSVPRYTFRLQLALRY